MRGRGTGADLIGVLSLSVRRVFRRFRPGSEIVWITRQETLSEYRVLGDVVIEHDRVAAHSVSAVGRTEVGGVIGVTVALVFHASRIGIDRTGELNSGRIERKR